MCSSTKFGAVTSIVLMTLFAASLIAADNDVSNIQTKTPKPTLESINKRLDILFGRYRNNHKILSDIQQRLVIFENITQEQTVFINEFRQLANNLPILMNDIFGLLQNQISAKNDQTAQVVDDDPLSLGRERPHGVVEVMNSPDLERMFVKIQDILVFIKDELNAAKIQQVFTSNENHLQPQFPLESSVPVGCDRVPSMENGIYRIKSTPDAEKSFYANCIGLDDTVKWTVILNRIEDDTNFFRSWSDYKLGFGNINKSFWIGLDKINEITSSRMHELLVMLEDYDGIKRQARYSMFAVADEEHGYALEVLGAYTGNAGDSLTYHAGQKFSTFDQDNDIWQEGSCALSHTGGWWYKQCDKSNLCGMYLGANTSISSQYQGVYWNDFHGPQYSLKRVQMMIRPIHA